VGDLAGVMTLAADPPPPYPAVCRDPDDDYLVALAQAALVDAVVTGDRDLLELEDVGVAVITPRALVERLADAG
jgi:predicted nucleic acid-binding protein